MIYLPVETSGEGALHAYSRAQMALSEARIRARDEFDGVINQRGRSVEELHEYVAAHPEMERALYRFPRQAGVAGEAAQFAWHVNDRMDGRRIRMSA
jgi:hypothetical protein